MKKTKKIVAPLNIGKLYLAKKCFWLLFPSKETAALAVAATYSLNDVAAVAAGSVADYWHQEYNCEVTYFSSDSHVVFLEEDGRYKKVLTSDGRIGWTWFKEEYNDCFEEVKSE